MGDRWSVAAKLLELADGVNRWAERGAGALACLCEARIAGWQRQLTPRGVVPDSQPPDDGAVDSFHLALDVPVMLADLSSYPTSPYRI
jgi:hypothetical protein